MPCSVFLAFERLTLVHNRKFPAVETKTGRFGVIFVPFLTCFRPSWVPSAFIGAARLFQEHLTDQTVGKKKSGDSSQVTKHCPAPTTHFVVHDRHPKHPQGNLLRLPDGVFPLARAQPPASIPESLY